MSRRRNQPIATWEPGDQVEGYALVTRKERRRDRLDQEYLDLELADSSGSIVAKAWPDSPPLSSDFSAHDFVHLQGSVKDYRGQLQVTVKTCRRIAEADRDAGFDEARLVPTVSGGIEPLAAALAAIYPGEIERSELRRLVDVVLAEHGDRLREHPAAKRIHHAYRGGLLEHTVSMARLAIGVGDHYPDVDRDLLLVGVLLHDLGKLRELGAMPVNEYTLEGRLVGHLAIGRDLLREACARIDGFPDELRIELEHLVLSHHGHREFGSPVEPATPEAIVLHHLDSLDSQLAQVDKVRSAGDGFQWVEGLGRRFWLGEG